jgi:hypothetical protein
VGALDEYGLPAPARPAPYDASLYLPPEEAVGLAPGACDLVAAACVAAGLPTPSEAAGRARERPKPLTFAQRALGQGLGKGAGSGGGEEGGGGTPRGGEEGSSGGGSGGGGAPPTLALALGGAPLGGGLTLADLARVHARTLPSYLAHSVAHMRLRAALRSAAAGVLGSSRVANGCGAIPGRGAPLAVDVGDESGYTALFICASAGRRESVALLVAAGAECTAVTKRGKTPIYGAIEKGHGEVVELLLPRYSANQLRANTTYGTNVLHAAQKCGNARIKDMLQVRGGAPRARAGEGGGTTPPFGKPAPVLTHTHTHPHPPPSSSHTPSRPPTPPRTRNRTTAWSTTCGRRASSSASARRAAQSLARRQTPRCASCAPWQRLPSARRRRRA